MAEEEGEQALGGEEEGEGEGEEEAADEAPPDTARSRADSVFDSFLGRCSEDIESRRNRRLQLIEGRNEITEKECTFKPNITSRTASSIQRQMAIWPSLYYRGLQQSQARVRRQRTRLEEVVEAERQACTFKPKKVKDVEKEWKEVVMTPRTPKGEAAQTPRSVPHKIDIHEEMSLHPRRAALGYREDPRKILNRSEFLDASVKRFEAVQQQIQTHIAGLEGMDGMTPNASTTRLAMNEDEGGEEEEEEEDA